MAKDYVFTLLTSGQNKRLRSIIPENDSITSPSTALVAIEGTLDSLDEGCCCGKCEPKYAEGGDGVTINEYIFPKKQTTLEFRWEANRIPTSFEVDISSGEKFNWGPKMDGGRVLLLKLNGPGKVTVKVEREGNGGGPFVWDQTYFNPQPTWKLNGQVVGGETIRILDTVVVDQREVNGIWRRLRIRYQFSTLRLLQLNQMGYYDEDYCCPGNVICHPTEFVWGPSPTDAFMVLGFAEEQAGLDNDLSPWVGIGTARRLFSNTDNRALAKDYESGGVFTPSLGTFEDRAPGTFPFSAWTGEEVMSFFLENMPSIQFEVMLPAAVRFQCPTFDRPYWNYTLSCYECLGCEKTTKTYSYNDSFPPGKWYACQGSAFESCANQVINAHIVEKFNRVQLAGRAIKAKVKDNSRIDNEGSIGGVYTVDNFPAALGRIQGDHDITDSLIIEDNDEDDCITAKIPVLLKNSNLGGPIGLAGTTIEWFCEPGIDVRARIARSPEIKPSTASSVPNSFWVSYEAAIASLSSNTEIVYQPVNSSWRKLTKNGNSSTYQLLESLSTNLSGGVTVSVLWEVVVTKIPTNETSGTYSITAYKIPLLLGTNMKEAPGTTDLIQLMELPSKPWIINKPFNRLCGENGLPPQGNSAGYWGVPMPNLTFEPSPFNIGYGESIQTGLPKTGSYTAGQTIVVPILNVKAKEPFSNFRWENTSNVLDTSAGRDCVKQEYGDDSFDIELELKFN